MHWFEIEAESDATSGLTFQARPSSCPLGGDSLDDNCKEISLGVERASWTPGVD